MGYMPLHILQAISGLNSPRPNYILTQIHMKIKTEVRYIHSHKRTILYKQ